MRFRNLQHLLAWYKTHNPARAKYPNQIEPNRAQRPWAEHFSGEHPDDIHAAITQGLNRILDNHDRWNRARRKVFNLCDLGRPFGYRLHPREAAEFTGIPKTTIYRWLNEIREDIEKEMTARDLLEKN